MKTEPVFIVDTNVLVSAHLVEGSVTDLAFKKALKLGAIGISEATMYELTEVVFRKKFDKYFKTDEARYKLIEKPIQTEKLKHTRSYFQRTKKSLSLPTLMTLFF